MANKLNLNQLVAVNFGEGPLLIIAGAGTGKTTVITERIKHLILDKNIDPEKLLALTFTEKAASEMQERIDIILPYGYSQMWIDTFHGFCEKILRNEALNIGLDSSFKLLSETDGVLLIKKNLIKFNFEYFRPLGNPTKLISALLFHFSRLKDENITASQYLEYAKKMQIDSKLEDEEKEKIKELANCYNAYEDLKNKEGYMDFSDLIFNTLQLFIKRPNILKRYQKKFEYILIDEFQDTNYIQNELAILLSNDKKNINVVGDDDQAIYRWRGAAISNMLQFKEKFPTSKIITLTKNYRSTQTILDAAYKLIRHNDPDRLEVKENIDKKLISDRMIKGEKIKLIFEKNNSDETEKIINEIGIIKSQKKYSYKDFAILIRVNDQALPFIRALERNSIPYKFLGPQKLFNQEEIKDLIAFLKIMLDFNDNVSLFRFLNLSTFSIENASLISLFNFAKRKNLTIFESFTQLNEISLKFEENKKLKKAFTFLQKSIEELKNKKAGEILFYFINELKILESYLKLNDNLTYLKSKNTAKFFEKIKKYEDQHEDSSIREVVDWIDLSMQIGEGPIVDDLSDNDEDSVNIITIHSSKGLEFKVVFMVNLVTNKFPSTERREQIPIPENLIKEILPSGNYHLEEERRLFYVGMTRAKDILYFTASKFYNEGKRERKLSTFIEEALDKIVFDKIKNIKEKKQLSLLNPKPIVEKINLANKETLNLTYVSYSQLQTYNFCNLHYKLKYVLKIPTPPSLKQSFGTSLHGTLRDFYLLIHDGKSKNEIDLNFIYKKNWINDGYAHKNDEEKFFNYGLNVVKNYLHNNFNPNMNSKAEVPFKFFIKNVCVGGIIDRIDFLENGIIEIIDYKTGNNILDEKELAKNLQLKIYDLAIISSKIIDQNIFDPEKIKLSLYYLEKGEKISVIKTIKELEKAKDEIFEKTKEIEKSEFECTGGIFCKECEYKMVCNA